MSAALPVLDSDHPISRPPRSVATVAGTQVNRVARVQARPAARVREPRTGDTAVATLEAAALIALAVAMIWVATALGVMR